MLRSIRIQEADFDIGAQWSALRGKLGAQAGAIVAFCGLVRDLHDDTSARGLFLEHYPGMTEQSLAAILDQAETRWSLAAVEVIHRVGRMQPGEQIVLVLTAARHRTEAFEACQFVMDYLKTEAVFWKKELGTSAEHWVVPTELDQRRRDGWREEP